MKHKQIKLIIIIAIALAQVLIGQVTFQTKVTSYGFMGMGAFKSTTKTSTARRCATDGRKAEIYRRNDENV